MTVIMRFNHMPEPDYSKRADFPSPMHIRDDLGTKGVLNHADGRMYDSYSAYKASVKRHGCEIMGDTKPQSFKPKRSEKAGHDIKRAIEQLKAK
jgi:hypothetical protein